MPLLFEKYPGIEGVNTPHIRLLYMKHTHITKIFLRKNLYFLLLIELKKKKSKHF